MLQVQFHLVVEVLGDGVIEEGGDGVEDAHVDAVGDEQEPVAGVGAQVDDGLEVGLLVVLLQLLSSVAYLGQLFNNLTQCLNTLSRGSILHLFFQE